MAGDGATKEFRITSSFEEISQLAEDVRDHCAAAGHYDGETLDSLRLSVAEALNNIVEHAYDGRIGMPIVTQVSAAPARCEVRLIDEGKPMPGGEIPDGSGSTFDPDDIENLPEGGFGWLLIRAEMDDVGYERREDRNFLRLTKLLEPAARPARADDGSRAD